MKDIFLGCVLDSHQVVFVCHLLVLRDTQTSAVIHTKTACSHIDTNTARALTHLHFEQPAAVRLEVTVVNLAHGVHVLVSDLLGDRSLIGQKELVEEPAVKTTTASISFFTLCPVISNAQLKTSSTQQKNNKQTVKRWVELPGQETEGGNVMSASDVAVTTSTFKFKNSPQIKLTQTCAQTYQQSNISNNSNQ